MASDDESVPAAELDDEVASEQLLERARRALIECALSAREDAGLRGLCPEGAWEATVSAMRHLDLRKLLKRGGEG